MHTLTTDAMFPGDALTALRNLAEAQSIMAGFMEGLFDFEQPDDAALWSVARSLTESARMYTDSFQKG
jgi:hypothetical protein